MDHLHPPSPEQLSQWIQGARDGNDGEFNMLADYLLKKAFDFAQWKMPKLSPVDDYEDVALSAVKSICVRFQRGEHKFKGEKELSGLLKKLSLIHISEPTRPY